MAWEYRQFSGSNHFIFMFPYPSPGTAISLVWIPGTDLVNSMVEECVHWQSAGLMCGLWLGRHDQGTGHGSIMATVRAGSVEWTFLNDPKVEC